MKKLILFLISIAGTALGSQAQIPEMLGRMIEKYPSAYRRVWYYYDHSNGIEFYRTQFSAPRHEISDNDVKDMTTSYLAEWDRTDFSKATGAQYQAPDSISITIKGNCVMAFDLGANEVTADWGQEVSSRRKWIAPDLRPIENVFSTIKKGHRVKVTKVSYTGFPRNVLFVFHRGAGNGLTKGERTTVYNVSLADFEKIRNAILSYIGRPIPVTVFDRTWQTMIKSESTPDFYAVGYDPRTKVLNFLHATVEKEICIPYDWQKINKLP